MGFFNQRAGRIRDRITSRAPGRAVAVGGSVRRNDDPVSGAAANCFQMATLDAQGRQMLLNDRVMHQIPQHRGWARSGGVVSFAQGVPDAEAHSVVFCQIDFHG